MLEYHQRMHVRMSSYLRPPKNDIYARRRRLTKAKREFMKTLSDFGVGSAYDVRIAAKALAYADAVGQIPRSHVCRGTTGGRNRARTGVRRKRDPARPRTVPDRGTQAVGPYSIDDATRF